MINIKSIAITITTVSVFSMGVVVTANAGPTSQRERVAPGSVNYYSHSAAEQFRDETRSSYYFERGIKQYQNQEFQLAKISFMKILDSNHFNEYRSQANAFMGLISARQNDHKSATKYFRRAISGNPDLYGLKSALGLSYVAMGNVTKAEAVLEGLKEKKERSVYQGAQEIDLRSSIQILEQALTET